MLERVLTIIVTAALKWLYDVVMNEANTRAERLAEEKKRGEIDEKNVIGYDEAKDRAERIRRAQDLLNGTDSTP